MKRGVIAVYLALFLIAIASVSAADFTVTHSGDNVVEIGGDIDFTLSITNNDFKTISLQITPEPYASLPSSYIELFSIEPKIVDVGSGQTKDVNVRVQMKDTVLPNDNYGTYVHVEDISKPESKLDHNLVLRVIPPDEVVSVTTSVPKLIAPGNEFSVDVTFKNNMNIQLSNIVANVGSEMFEEKKTMILFPLQKRTETFKFKIPSMAKPQDYSFTVRVYHDGVLNGNFDQRFSVSQNADVKQEVTVEKSFLTEVITVTKTNFGNFVATEYYDYPASRFDRMFISSSVDSSKDSSGLHWMFAVNPGEKMVLKIKRSYLPLLILLVVVALFSAVSYYLLTRGMIVRKKIFRLMKGAHGAAQFTVMLHVKNRTSGTVKDLVIYEILPNMINPSTHFGTLKPDTTQKGESGTKLIWKIPELTKGEERIISYQVDSKIEVIGTVALPPCMLRYKTHKGRVVNVRSNPVSLSIGMEKQ